MGVLVAYVIADSSQIHIDVRQHVLSVSLSDLPLVVGLLLLNPWWLLAARLTSAVVVFLVRRRALRKSIFNLCLFTAEIGVGATLVRVFDVTDGTSARQWATTYAVILTVDLLVAMMIVLAIAILGTRLSRQEVLATVVSGWGSAVIGTTLGLITLVVLSASLAGMGLLAVLFLVTAMAHRAYYRLLRRHTDLGQLFTFTQTVGAAQTTDEVVATLLDRAKDLLRAEQSVLRLQADDPLEGLPVSAGTALIVPRTTRDPALRQWLTTQNLRDALMVPLHDRGRVFAILQVGNRIGQTSTFGFEDLHLLQTLAAHAELIRDNGKLVEQLRFDATHDGLTGLANRSQFRRELGAHVRERALSDCTGSATALLLLDLDRFKEVNDTLGHPVGDHLLRMVAERITQHVPPGSVVARLGGDEFAVLLPTGVPGVELAGQVRRGLAQPFAVEGTYLEVGASVGVAVIPDDGEDASTLLQHADVAMYAAKHLPAGVARYAAEDDRSSLDQLAMAGDLRRGLEGGQVVMHLQPQSRLADGRLVAFEALARWNHPSRGLIMPDDFIPLAERTGLIGQLTHVALRQALTACRDWQDRWPDVGVAVNLSARQLLDPDLTSSVATLLQLHGVPPHLLTLEITEGSIIADARGASAALHPLRELGVRLSIDDFGTGYSALSYLQRLPIDELKIDKSFVMAMTTDEGAHAIVGAIIDLAHTLGLSVVAEGVEDVGARSLLEDAGCDVMQGYLLSRPIPPQAVPTFLERHQTGSTFVN